MATSTRQQKAERGSIDKLPSGALRVRVYAGRDPVSKRNNYLVETIPPGPNQAKEARKARTRLVNQVDEQRHPRTKATLSQLLDKYLAVANLDPGTLRGYQRNYRNHVKPLLGETKVGAIDAHVLDSFYAELRRCRARCDGKRHIDHRTTKLHECDERCRVHKCEPLAPSTVRRIHFLLSGAFKRAVRWGWITSNPAATAEPPAEPKPDPQPPTPAEAARIVNAAWSDPMWGTLVWVAMTTGVRRAELSALRWRHVDLDNGTLEVRRSIDQSGGQLSEKTTKTHQHRRIALDAETVAILSDYKAASDETAAKLETALTPDSFVFSLSADGRTPIKPDTITQRYGRLAKRLGISTTFHKLRHFSATELITAGVDPRTVGGRLGHGSGGATTLRVYSAWVSESDQRAAESFTSRMPLRPEPPVSRAERAKTNPSAPYERAAAKIRSQVLSGELRPGDFVPPQKKIMADHKLSAGTANRAVELLRTWKVIEVSRGKRAVILQPPPEPEPGPATQQATSADTQLMDIRLLHGGDEVRTFSVECDPADPKQLTRLLTSAARRHGGRTVELDDYEIEVRQAGMPELITRLAAL